MSRNGKVLVAMSGGVDSSVAAALLKEQGYDCVGVFLRTGAQAEEAACAIDSSASLPGGFQPTATQALPQVPRRLKHGCCSATDAQDARSVAAKLGIPFYALNFEPEFERIIDYFVAEYAQARTPNPCVVCNIEVKFGKLLEYAELVDAEFIATGHYARIVTADDGTPRLARAANVSKDQSYVLFGIDRGVLGRCLFPLGEMANKAEVRRLAASLGLQTHDKPDSQEICFVPQNDYRRLLEKRRPELFTTGEMRDSAGRVLREHSGVAGFTIGQRHGLGLAVGQPVYVTRLDRDSNTVTVGPREELLSHGLIAERVNWLSPAPPPETKLRVEAKIRHMHAPAPAALTRRGGDCVAVDFDAPQSAVTPGQAAVFYQDGIVLAGGWIAASTAKPLNA